MANITEQDIINHIKEKIKFHQNEAKRLEHILTAFDSDTNTPRSRKAKIAAVDEALDSTDEQAGKRKSAKANAASDADIAAQTPLEIPEKYTDSLPVNAKIAFALNEIGGSGFSEDIANTMAQYEPKSDAQKISKQISGALTTLKSNGQLKAEKEGRKEKFTLIQ